MSALGPVTEALSQRSHAAAKYLDEVGWTQGTMQDGEGHVCATGAVMYCQPQNGDEYIIREVLRRRGTAESWNDEDGRTAAEVRAVLDRDITDADLIDTFGPQALEIVAVIRRAAALTVDEAREMAAAWAAAWAAARDAARAAAWAAARDAARAAARDAARDAAWAAAAALIVRDLIGQDGFTQENYDKLSGPWRRVIGKIHADDVDLRVEVSE
jgi:hypothetical protein